MPHLFPTLIARGLTRAVSSGGLALSATDLTVDPGTIHVVVGLSGAGKTLLADVLGGVLRSSGGTFHLDGQLTSPANESDAISKGIRYVKQVWDVRAGAAVVDVLDLGPVPKRFGLVDTHALRERASAYLASFGLADVDPKTRVDELPAGKRKLLQIAAALAKPSALLLLDDPTGPLTDAESHVLYERLSQLQYAKTGVLYFTPRAQEALEVGDRISVMRDGQLISEHYPDEVFIHQLTGEMYGRDVNSGPPPPLRQYGPEVSLRVEYLCVGSKISGFGLKAKRGEIVGLLGLAGAGQSEVLRAIAGVEQRREGAIYLRGSGVAASIGNRDHALANGLGFIDDVRDAVPEVVNVRLQLRTLNASNPQRGPIAKCLQAACSVLLFDGPTRGLNVACRLEVHRAILEIASQGITVVAASTDVDELTRICDRIILVVNGIAARSVERSAFDAEKMFAYLKKPV